MAVRSRDLAAGEFVIVSGRPQARRLVWPAIVTILVPVLGLYAMAWLFRGNLGKAFAPLAGWKDALMLVVAVLGVAVLVLFCLRRLLAWLSVKYVLTSQRIIVRQGWFSRNRRDYPLASVRHLGTRQSALQRILRSGNISLDLGIEGQASLPDVPEVERFRGFALAAINELPHVALDQGQWDDGYENSGHGDYGHGNSGYRDYGEGENYG